MRAKRSPVESFVSINKDILRQAICQLNMGSNPDPQPLPFWQVNIQSDEREEECPEPLQNLSAKDMGIIGTRDEDYCVQSWEQVVDIVRSGRLQDFGRWPSELRMYREFVWKVKQDRGSVMEYMLTERLHWEQPIVSRSRRPFEHEDDFRILFNDWPYGIDNRIVHLVVWTKFDLEDDAETETKIERFIQRTFSSEVPEDKVSGASGRGVRFFHTDTIAARLVQKPAQLEICPRRGAHPCDAL